MEFQPDVSSNAGMTMSCQTPGMTPSEPILHQSSSGKKTPKPIDHHPQGNLVKRRVSFVDAIHEGQKKQKIRQHDTPRRPLIPIDEPYEEDHQEYDEEEPDEDPSQTSSSKISSSQNENESEEN